MCKKITVAILVMLSHAIAQADDVHYRWSRSGSASVSSDCKQIHLDSGASACLTVRGAGRLTFSVKGGFGFYYKKDSQSAIDIAYNSARSISVDLSGDKDHTIEWYTTANPYFYYQEWGEVTSITWKGTAVMYAAIVEFDPNGGECESALCHVKHGGTVNTLPSATRKGFSFDGWHTQREGGVKISNTYTVSSDIILYAHWTANKYTITFNANGGEGGTSTSLSYDTTLGTLPEATRYDFDFGGWWTAANGGLEISSSMKVTGDVTYYAHWIDPIPELTGAVTDDMVSEALSGSADSRIISKITTPPLYNEYRQWINSKELSHKAAKASPNAWLSYALDASALMARNAPLTSEDVVIESIEPSNATAGGFDLVINIADAEVGEGARLAEALGVEGAAELDESAFSSDGLVVNFSRTADGRAKATVAPDGAPTAFFMRVRVK